MPLQGGRGINAADNDVDKLISRLEERRLQGGRGINAADNPELVACVDRARWASMRPRHQCRG